MNPNHKILKILFILFTLPYLITTKYIGNHNEPARLHKKFDSKMYSLEMLQVPNLEPNINQQNGIMHHQSTTDNFVRRIPLYTYAPYFLGYLDEHEQIRKAKEAAEASTTKLQQYIPFNIEDDREIQDALNFKRNDPNSKITKLKKTHDEDVKEALEIMKKIAVQKNAIHKQQNKSKLKKITTTKFRNDGTAMSGEESAETFRIVKNGGSKQTKPIKTVKTKKQTDDIDDAATYLQSFYNPQQQNSNEDEIISTAPKRGKRFDEIIENNPYELLKALIDHETRLSSSTNYDIGKDQGVCKYLELANILGCFGNTDKINNICKGILNGCSCTGCKHNKSASEVILNYTNMTDDSESEEDKFHYEHIITNNLEKKDARKSDLKELVANQIEKTESKENLNNKENNHENEVAIKDYDLNKTLEDIFANEEKFNSDTKEDKEVEIIEKVSNEKTEKI